MNETKKVFKIFFVWDFEKEERWLNQMAMEGWVLEEVSFFGYTFRRCEPGEYILRLEMNPWEQNTSAALSTGAISAGRQSWTALIFCRI